ncbi:MAG TPA: type II toxin-antitoxin system VapC family toxin [Terriglobales bacterium]|nr:type II toxin-antitoxin system VapC family toxin [Terriglobales bacterium]
MILLDTSVVVDAFAEGGNVFRRLRRAIAGGERLASCTLVIYEWQRGPRRPGEIAAQEVVIPAAEAWPFGAAEAVLAAELYRRVRRARQREVDLGIAACALVRGAQLWTLNPDDFRDIPGLTLYQPPA